MYEKELAKLICERFQPTMELVRFTNSGTEANMMAVAVAMAWTGRKKIVVFRGGYHGATLSFRAPIAEATHQSVNLPHEWVIGTYNDIAKTEDVLSTLPATSVAAILVEPMLGNAGAIPGSLSFLQFLRSYASSHGILLIFDEVMTSRLSYRGLSHKLGIQPDLMTLGKWAGGGMSFGAFGGRANIMALFDPTKSGGLAHAGTFNNNVISMAAGCAGCKVLDEETTNQLNGLGEILKENTQNVIDKTLNAHASNKIDVFGSPSKGDALLNAFQGHRAITHVWNTMQTNRLSLGLSHIASEDILEDRQTSHNSTKCSNGLATPGDHTPLGGYTPHPTFTSSTPPMYISGIGSILAIHLPSTQLQSIFYHHMLSKGIYLAERGFIALNIELGMAEVERFVAATGEFVENYKEMILGS